MKYVPAPDQLEIVLTTVTDDPVVDGVYPSDHPTKAGQPKPATAIYEKFLLGRLADEAFFDFGGEKRGVDAQEIIFEARAQIKKNAGQRYYAFEDEVAKRLQQAILHPKQGFLSQQLFLEHNWRPWVDCWKKLLESPPAVLAVEPTPEPAPLEHLS